MDCASFLHELWGPTPPGFVQVWSLTDRRSEYYAATNINFDAQPDVFTAICTTARRLGARQRAKADQTAALCGLVLDIDVGPGKLDNRTQALSFANKYARPTITVDSGSGGIHAYYLFPEPWIFRQISERERAKTILQQWVGLHQVAAAQRGWHLDSVGDLARVLRVPGSLNAKTDPAGVVTVLEDQGPRHTYSDLAKHLSAMPIITERAPVQALDLHTDNTAFGAKLDALLANSPEFAATWEHQRAPGDGSPSAYDMSLCTLAAGAMTNGELVLLMQAHCDKWAVWMASHDSAEGRPDGHSWRKRRRTSYLAATCTRARGERRPDMSSRRAA